MRAALAAVSRGVHAELTGVVNDKKYREATLPGIFLLSSNSALLGGVADLPAAAEGLLVERVELRALGAELLEGGLQHVLGGQDLGVADDRADHDEVQDLRIAKLVGDGAGVNLDDVDVLAVGLHRDDGAVDEDGAAGDDGVLELDHGGVVKSNDVVGLGHLRRADGVVGDDDVAVGGAAAHAQRRSSGSR